MIDKLDDGATDAEQCRDDSRRSLNTRQSHTEWAVLRYANVPIGNLKVAVLTPEYPGHSHDPGQVDAGTAGHGAGVDDGEGGQDAVGAVDEHEGQAGVGALENARSEEGATDDRAQICNPDRETGQQGLFLMPR